MLRTPRHWRTLTAQFASSCSRCPETFSSACSFTARHIKTDGWHVPPSVKDKELHDTKYVRVRGGEGAYHFQMPLGHANSCPILSKGLRKQVLQVVLAAQLR